MHESFVSANVLKKAGKEKHNLLKIVWPDYHTVQDFLTENERPHFRI